MSEILKRTPLYNAHVALGGKIVPFAGWEMPVQYSGVIAEHHATRTAAGLFDVSHMGEVIVTGPEAEKAIDWLTCNDVKKLYDGKAQYSAITNTSGGIVDDIIVYRFNSEHFLICVNASNADKDFEWMCKNNKFNAKFENHSERYGQIAIQGPKAVAAMQELIPECDSVRYFHFKQSKINGIDVILARTGYTGEDGFEIFTPAKSTEEIWNLILEKGRTFGVVPAGLGARDSLRLEASYPLYGHELGDNISAIESGLGWIVKINKGEFIGKPTIQKHLTEGAPRSLIGFFIDEPGIARQEDRILNSEGQEIGWVTSGTKTPTINKSLGMAIVNSKFAQAGTEILAQVRGKNLKAHVVKLPFYIKPEAKCSSPKI